MDVPIAPPTRCAASSRRGQGGAEVSRLVERTTQVLGSYIYRQTHQRPMILPVVTEIQRVSHHPAIHEQKEAGAITGSPGFFAEYAQMS